MNIKEDVLIDENTKQWHDISLSDRVPKGNSHNCHGYDRCGIRQSVAQGARSVRPPSNHGPQVPQ